MKRLSKPWTVFVVTVLVHGLTTRGRPVLAADTPLLVKLADGFRGGDFSGAFNEAFVRWSKSVIIALLAAARTISPAHWAAIMVALNVICSGVVAVLLVDLVRRSTRSPAAPVVALLLYLASYEVFQWLPMILTDPIFCAVSFVPFYLLARRIVGDEPPRTILLAASLLLALFTRPPGILLVPLVLFVELVLIRRRVSVKSAAAVILVIAAVTLVVRSAVVDDPARWPFPFVRPILSWISMREKAGEVVMDRKETYRRPARNAADHAVIVADRTGRFLQFASPAYSRAHNIGNVLWFVPVYALGAIGIVDGLRRSGRRRRSLVVALLVWIALFAYFYGLSVLDYDWRFRTPLIPHFILLAACGFDALAMRWHRGDAEPAR